MNQDFEVPFDVDFQVPVTTPKVHITHNQAVIEPSSTLSGVILPADFQQDPRFKFQGPSLEEVFAVQGSTNLENPAMEALIAAMTPVTSSGYNFENEDIPRRSTWVRQTPLLYQSDVVEQEEKNKH